MPPACNKSLLRSVAGPVLPRRISHAARGYSAAAPKARLNVPVDFAATPLLHHSQKSCQQDSRLPASVRQSATKRLNYFQAVNDAMRTALNQDERVVIFGEDVAFGGVFRCTMNLANEFGSDRVFNTPLSEQGIIGFAIGCAAQGLKPLAELQFADYMYPAFDQLVNEAAKFRYREGSTGFNCGGMVVRMPCGGVGHGALYHSQSPESLFMHIPGLRVVLPRSPLQAKGLLLAAIASSDPVVILEPKILYRAAVEQVPVEAYELPLSKAEVMKQGEHVTVVSYGAPLYSCSQAIAAAEKDLGVSVELIDLRTIYPWDKPTVVESVKKTGRVVIVHESMVSAGVGAEVAATLQEEAFLHLEAPIQRVGGATTHSGLLYERFNVPDVARIYDAIKQSIKY